MQYLEVTPHPTLSTYVDAYWTASGNSEKQRIEKILPDGCVDIIFNLGNDCYTDNGTILMKDGSVKMKNGKTKMMMDGDCMYMDGRMKKMKKDEMKSDK